MEVHSAARTCEHINARADHVANADHGDVHRI
jgi:hypothetical protein